MTWKQPITFILASLLFASAQTPAPNQDLQPVPGPATNPMPMSVLPQRPGTASVQQAPALPDTDQPAPPRSLTARFEYGLLDGLAKIEELTAAEDYAGAKQVGEELLVLRSFDAWRGALDLEDDSWWNPILDQAEPFAEYLKLSFTRGEKAHLQYTLGVVALAEADAKTAKDRFETTTATAGSGSLRSAASYNISTLALLTGESWRAQMPEFGGQPQAPPTPGPSAPGAPPADPDEPPDPLQEARAAYLAAKAGFVQRLRMDWSDADTRANMELVMRRLRELDEIEQQREEQEQEQQEDENQEESEDSESDEEKKENQDPSEDEQENDSSKEDQDESQDNQEEPENPEPEEPTEEEQEDPDPSEQEQEGGEEEAQEQPAKPKQEQYLTKEEVQRLLDRLKEHEEKGQELRERKRQGRRPTPRDW